MFIFYNPSPSIYTTYKAKHIKLSRTKTQTKLDQTTLNMPLVVPGITSNSGDKTEEWTNKLVGKKVSDDAHSEVVSLLSPFHVPFLFHPTRYFAGLTFGTTELLQEGSPSGVPRH